MKDKIKLCMLIGFNYYEDLENFTPPRVEIVSYLKNYGNSIISVFLSNSKVSISPKFESQNIYLIPCKNRSLRTTKNVFSALRCYLNRFNFLKKIIPNANFDWIYVRNEIFNGLLAVYFKKKYEISFVLEMENPLEQEYYFRKFYFPKLIPFWYIISKIELIIKLYIMKNSDLILAISEFMRNDFIKKGFEPDKIIIVPEGIDFAKFSDKKVNEIDNKYSLDNKYLKIIYVGTLDKARELEIIIYAFNEVLKQCPSKLIIVGEGNGIQNLKKLSKELNIKNSIVFKGSVKHSEIPALIQSSDVGLSPVPPKEIYLSSSPIKLHEYMAMKKPVIANYEIPEHKEVLTSSKGGLLVKFTPEDFSEAMINLLNNENKRLKLGNNGFNWLKENRSYEILANKLSNTLLKLT